VVAVPPPVLPVPPLVVPVPVPVVLLVPELVPVPAWLPLLEQLARAHTPTLIPEPEVVVPVALPVPPALPVAAPAPAPGPVVAAVKVAVMAGGEAVDGGDGAAWALVWLSRNIPLAPAARIRPR
jgi:hypothetical protein